MEFWDELTTLMAETGRGVDFVTIDGGEGGTGAAPLIFTDSVSLPFQLGFSRVYTKFAERNLQEQVVFVGGGKLGLPDNAIVAFALGCDMVNVAREAMLSIGCIQAQKCHTDTCPTGVATQNAWLAHGLDPQLKSVRLANYVKTLRRDLVKVAEACGVEHPGLIDAGLGGDSRRPDRVHLTPGRLPVPDRLGAALRCRSGGDHRVDDRHRGTGLQRTAVRFGRWVIVLPGLRTLADTSVNQSNGGS